LPTDQNNLEFQLVLYSTSACHLCEQAEGVIASSIPASGYPWRKVDIALDDALLGRYGASIPVLAKIKNSGVESELFWPFNPEEVRRFIFK
jgi:hypothetical protein